MQEEESLFNEVKSKILRDLNTIKVRYLNPALAGNPRGMMVDLEERFCIIPEPTRINLLDWADSLCLKKKNPSLESVYLANPLDVHSIKTAMETIENY